MLSGFTEHSECFEAPTEYISNVQWNIWCHAILWHFENNNNARVTVPISHWISVEFSATFHVKPLLYHKPRRTQSFGGCTVWTVLTSIFPWMSKVLLIAESCNLPLGQIFCALWITHESPLLSQSSSFWRTSFAQLMISAFWRQSSGLA